MYPGVVFEKCRPSSQRVKRLELIQCGSELTNFHRVSCYQGVEQHSAVTLWDFISFHVMSVVIDQVVLLKQLQKEHRMASPAG